MSEQKTQGSRIERLSVALTLWGCIVVLLICLFQATTETNYAAAVHTLVCLCVLGVIAVVLHLLRSLVGKMKPQQRLLHVVLAALICFLLSWAIPAAVKRHFLGLRWAFLEQRIEHYDLMVSRIKDNRHLLSQDFTSVGHLVGRPAVMARTNKDGSFHIYFHGRVDGSILDDKRVAYLYYNGPVIPHPSEPAYYTEPHFKAYRYRLTNDWYEFP